MRAFISSILFVFVSTFAFAQAEDSTIMVSDTTYVFDTTYVDDDYQYQDSYDSGYAESTYTRHPGELDPTKNELNKSYREKKFSKTEWKRIIGETNYIEEQVEEKKKEENKPYKAPSLAWTPVVLKIIGYVLILVLLAGVIYYLFKNAMKDGSVKNSINTDSLLYDNKHIDEVREDDLERLLREALDRNDFRAAVRLYYIKLLKHLHSTGFIAWKKDKTNRDYAIELAALPFTRDFRKLMTAYEIIWYGERTPSLEEFRKLQLNFDNLQRQADRKHEE